MEEKVSEQKKIFEEIYSPQGDFKFEFHITKDPLTRYLRDRRIINGIKQIKKNTNENILSWKVLIVCGGVGGEGIFFIKNGFIDVTVSDISANSLKICNKLDPEIKTLVLNGEDLALEDNSFDLVLVQDGLHHLPRPSLGFTEMLRVAKKAVIVIEPYDSFIGNAIGTKWEIHGSAVNYVYRWNVNSVSQLVKSYLLKNYKLIKVLRFWDHNVIIGRIANKFPKKHRLKVAKALYALLKPFDSLGNMMVAVILK